MKSLRLLSFFLCLLLALGCATSKRGQMALLPGITYYSDHEELQGKLVFLLSPSFQDNRATIYELDLERRAIKKVTDTPAGSFVPSADGEVFCVISWPPGRGPGETTAFIYHVPTGRSRTIRLPGLLMEATSVDGHVFFNLSATNGMRILQYAVSRDEKQWLELPGASRWEFEYYERIYAPRGTTNLLYFYYRTLGDRLEATGTDYPSGFYAFDVSTGLIRPAVDADDLGDRYKTADGRYIFFMGTGAPYQGSLLASTTRRSVFFEEQAPKAQDVRVLHKFRGASPARGRTFVFAGLSPCDGYALVSFTEPAMAQGWLPGWSHTYYVVNLLTGKASVLLKERVLQTTGGSVSRVFWIR